MTSRLGMRTYTYDERNRLKIVNDPLQGLTTIDYDLVGRRKTVSYANGVTASFGYNGRGDLLSIAYRNQQLVTIFQITYTYDDTGNVKTMTDDTGVTGYFYDAAGQLTEVHYPDGRIVTYTYDPVGNRQTMTDTNGLHSYIYDIADRLLSVDGIAYSYDNNGNMISETHPVNGITGYAYDFENHLTRVSRETIQYSTHLNSGWNFFALPGEPINPNISNVLNTLTIGTDYDQLSRFNSQTQSFEHYIGNTEFNQFSTMEYGKGYEIFVTHPSGVNLTIDNLTAPPVKYIPLTQNWNLIGSPSQTPIPIPEALNNLTFGIDYSQVSRWNSNLQTYDHYMNLPSDNFNQLDAGTSYCCMPCETPHGRRRSRESGNLRT